MDLARRGAGGYRCVRRRGYSAAVASPLVAACELGGRSLLPTIHLCQPCGLLSWRIGALSRRCGAGGALCWRKAAALEVDSCCACGGRAGFCGRNSFCGRETFCGREFNGCDTMGVELKSRVECWVCGGRRELCGRNSFCRRAEFRGREFDGCDTMGGELKSRVECWVCSGRRELCGRDSLCKRAKFCGREFGECTAFGGGLKERLFEKRVSFGRGEVLGRL